MFLLKSAGFFCALCIGNREKGRFFRKNAMLKTKTRAYNEFIK
ncbi:hypothetical protein BRYFOR_09203 [Marvinbryantia formatexigens DSM 14469]|uniref:Uncharacterized protein n=1 Tax=Marvinbryantia formatexigens DSM 14469 TaxID=478749 RepID=C6LKL5_9FIRM|nr:hypothetical protein BRYFOR_09203 [Marvinbryantia formatexigens DSM 14469]